MNGLELRDIITAYVALYPIVTAGFWVAGGLLFRIFEEPRRVEEPSEGWPGVTVLIPAHNEELVIERSVRAAREVDYPALEVVVLDDGSTDATARVAQQAAEGDPRVRVSREEINVGKADTLNRGFQMATHDLVVVADADTTLHPAALRMLATRISRSPSIAAVAGSAHIANRGKTLVALQVLEFTSIVGLIRRTQALHGHVTVVAGVLGMFRRDAVLDVGGYDGRMATEDIDLSYRLLLSGRETDFEPHALVGMEAPTTLRGLWMQRTRWARGQGEVLHAHARQLAGWGNRRLWGPAGESVLSVLWLVLAVVVLVLTIVDVANTPLGIYQLSLAWGIAIAVVSTAQTAVALSLTSRYDHTVSWPFLLGPLYPAGYWMLAAAATLHSELSAIWRGPPGERVVWDMPRDRDTDAPSAPRL